MQELTFFDNTAQVYLIESDEFIRSSDSNLSEYVSFLSEQEKERYYKYKNEKARFTFLTARCYLRNLIVLILRNTYALQPLQSLRDSSPTIRGGASEFCNDGNKLPPLPKGDVSKADRGILSISTTHQSHLLKIETTPSGKPFLTDYPNIYFNISHTDGLIAIAFADSPIGVDVEHIDRKADKEAIIKHFFSQKEQESYFNQSEENKQLAFFKGWTRKEALLKATGEGLVNMKNYEVSFELNTDFPIINKTNHFNFKIKDFTYNNYVGCIAIC